MGTVGGIDAAANVVRALESAERVAGVLARAASAHDPLIGGNLRGSLARARELAHARSDAARAIGLLSRDSGPLPALEPLVDALRGTELLATMRRTTTGDVRESLHVLNLERRAGEAWLHAAPLDDAARRELVERIRTSDLVDIPRDDWRAFAGILADDVDGELTRGLPRSLDERRLSARDMALHIAFDDSTARNVGSPYFVGHQYQDVWNASLIDVETRRARIAELTATDPTALDRGEWRELNALLLAGGHDVIELAWFPGLDPAFATRHAMLGGYDVARSFAPRLDFASTTEIQRAVQQLRGAGEIDELAQEIVRDDRLHLVGITGDEAAAIRLRHMYPTWPSAARTWLVDVRGALEAVPASGPAAKLRASALEMVERNLKRIDGERRWVPRDGYKNHPDYAELGRIRATWQLLERLQQGPAPAGQAAELAGRRLLRW